MLQFDSVKDAAQEVISQTKGQIRLGIPLGLGKPNQFVNALYQAACADSSIKLDIFTALSLERPRGQSGLEARFLKPFADRVYGDYVDLEYISAIRKNTLPSNITVQEFFVRPGAELNNAYAQQHYMSSNYTHAARDLNNCKVNVLAQSLAIENGEGQDSYSMSCNPEVVLDLLPLVEERRNRGEKIIVLGQINTNLPFMGNHALVKEGQLDILINDSNCYSTLYSTPNMPVNNIEYFIGLNASALVKDGGTLQIGIGALGDALAHALLLREQRNDIYQKIIEQSRLSHFFASVISSEGGTNIFNKGLYACSEMFTYGLLRLVEENIIRRRVLDKEGRSIFLHAGFFLGPRDMYDKLKSLSDDKRQAIDMLNISFVNGLYGDEALKRQQRVDARFVNSAFSVTLLGAGIADQLEDGRVLSGVGGQYNFVAQAHELKGARSILLVRATRNSSGEISSNIVWNYGHTTIPRHLRDIVVTEYGIADLRSKTDAQCIKAMLNITDSRFQSELLEEAKSHGKIESDYFIPEKFKENLPEKLEKTMRFFKDEGFFPDFPLGSDFDETERDLIKALSWLKSHVKPAKFFELAKNLVVSDAEEKRFANHLVRMNLRDAASLKEKIYRQLLLAALTASA